MGNDLIAEAVRRRIANQRRSQAFYIALGGVVSICGGAVLAALWIWFRTDDSEVATQLASLSAGMLSAGAGGYLFKEAISCRQSITAGEEWIALYEQARTPPPDARLGIIEERIFAWLTG